EHTEPLYYLVGETFTGDRGLIESFIGPDELSAQFDFPIYFTLRNTLASYTHGDGSPAPLSELAQAVHDSDDAFGAAPMAPFLGNHDVPRFVTQAAIMLSGDPNAQAWQTPQVSVPPDEAGYFKLRLAMTFVLTSPGVPLIYYGDEIGEPGAGD